MAKSATFTARLRRSIGESKTTSAALAKALLVSPTLVSLWVKGERRPSIQQVGEIGRFLQVDASWLAGSSENPPGSDSQDEIVEMGWFFRSPPDDGGRDYGNPNVFATPADISTLVRETGQNSLDAALGVGAPVTLRYTVIEVAAGTAAYTEFAKAILLGDLKSHIQAASETESKLGTRLRAGLSNLESERRLLLLRIDDYGTTGLYGSDTSGAVASPFAALVRNNLDSSKQTTTAGGSFGLGKAVLWRCSDLSTVLFVSKVAPGLEPQELGSRFIAKTELTWHELGGEGFAGPGWLGRQGTNGQSAYVSDGFLEAAFIPRSDLPTGVDANRDSGTSILIIGFSDPEATNLGDAKDLAERIAREAARNFWPAIQRGRIRILVDSLVRGDRDASIVVPNAEHVPELRNTLSSHDNQEVVEVLKDPGDVVRSEIPLTIPATTRGAKGVNAFDELTTTASLLVRLATPEEVVSGEINRVALVRGRGMVVKYWRRENVVVGAQPFHAVLLVGEAAGSEPPHIAAEQFFRLAEPPAHDDWKFNEEIREKYERGAKGKLAAVFTKVSEALRKIIAPPVKEREEGPAELKRLLQLNVPPAPARPSATLRNVVDSIEGGRWTVEAEIHVNDREKAWKISPRLWLRTEDGSAIRVSWHLLEELPVGVVNRQGHDFLISPNTKRFKFRAVSEAVAEGIEVVRCRADLDILATAQEA